MSKKFERIQWDELTKSTRKRQLYEIDLAFREGWKWANEVLHDDRSEVLERTALLLIKPDGLVSGRLGTIVDYVLTKGFQIAALEVVKLGRLQWREMWRYQMTMATLDRIAVNDLILQGDSLLLGLRGTLNISIPASVYLTSLKGVSDISKQKDDCLRRLLNQPNQMFSLFHVADEPADILRELTILLPPLKLQRFLRTLRRGNVLSSAKQLMLKNLIWHFSANPIDLGYLKPIAKIEAALIESSHHHRLPKPYREQVTFALNLMRRGRNVEWEIFVEALSKCGIRLEKWELASIGAEFVERDEPGRSRLIDSIAAEDWATCVRIAAAQQQITKS
jgi:hypothetical protein